MKLVLTLLTFILLSFPVAQAVSEENAPLATKLEWQKSPFIIEGSVEGYGEQRYLIELNKGDRFQLTLTPTNLSTYFNVYAPETESMKDGAWYIGPTDGNQLDLQVDQSGVYLIQVFLYRNAARRGEESQYRLEFQRN
ncbi:hypothetical protein [Paraferrimonas sedimenticola]|uniref:DNA breaking-rejoining protein n=1 Tax=Paraferrimonas sedimenticola TaxID=375674 RepID=A0AA37RSF9_9GAMM|nr:hypothetical protein [Paraferrimonas sedimenticola]GLP95115.1 DNA breaking-rejoining protein [Paraferrimonas sedimenticola]